MKKLLKYSKSHQAKKFFKKHPQLEIAFKNCLKSIVRSEKSIFDFDIKKLQGIKDGFRFRKGNQRIVFIMTSDYKIIIIEVKEANNRGYIYK